MANNANIEGLQELCQEILPLWQEQVNAVRVQTEDAIYALTSRFMKIAEKLGPEHAADVNDLLISLQFADRSAQILDAVRNDMGKLSDVLGEPGTAPANKLDVEAWRATLSATYTTAEQRDIHAGGTVGAVTPDDEISFF